MLRLMGMQERLVFAVVLIAYVLNRLPRLLITHFDTQYRIIMKIICCQKSHNSKLKRRNGHLRTILVEIGAMKHGNFSAKIYCSRTLSRRKNHLAKYTDRITATEADLLAVCGDVVYHYVTYQTENKDVNYRHPDKTHKYMLKHYIRDHNLIVTEFDQDYDNATHRALQCILHSWSVNSLKAFRYSVCAQSQQYIKRDDHFMLYS